MKNSHWRSFKKGMSWFLVFAIAMGSQGTGLSAATFDYGQDYGYQQEEVLSADQSYSSEDVQIEDVPAQGSEADTSQIQDIAAPDREADPSQVEDTAAPDSEADTSQVEDTAAPDSEADTSKIEDVFTDGESVLTDSNEETADTTLLDAPADAQEGTIQYLIEEARKAGSTTLTLSLGENFPDTVEENLLIPHGMDVVLDLNGHTLTVDKSSAEAGKDTNNITVYGQLTLQNGTLSGSASSLGNENTRGVFVCYGGRLVLGEGAEITGYAAAGRGGGVYVNEGASLSIEGGMIRGNSSGISGGGIWIYHASDFSYQSGAITGNSAALNGGGVYIQSYDVKQVPLAAGFPLQRITQIRMGEAFTSIVCLMWKINGYLMA